MNFNPLFKLLFCFAFFVLIVIESNTVRSIIENENILFTWSFYRIMFLEEIQDYEEFYLVHYKNQLEKTKNGTYFECTTAILLNNLEKLGSKSDLDNLNNYFKIFFDENFRVKNKHIYDIENKLLNITRFLEIKSLEYYCEFIQSFISVYLIIIYEDNLLSSEAKNYIIDAANLFRNGFYYSLKNKKEIFYYNHSISNCEQWQIICNNGSINFSYSFKNAQFCLLFYNIVNFFIYEMEKYIQLNIKDYWKIKTDDEVSKLLWQINFSQYIKMNISKIFETVRIEIDNFIEILLDDKQNYKLSTRRIYIYKENSDKLKLSLGAYFNFRFGRQSLLINFLTRLTSENIDLLYKIFFTSIETKNKSHNFKEIIYIYYTNK